MFLPTLEVICSTRLGIGRVVSLKASVEFDRDKAGGYCIDQWGAASSLRGRHLPAKGATDAPPRHEMKENAVPCCPALNFEGMDVVKATTGVDDDQLSVEFIFGFSGAVSGRLIGMRSCKEPVSTVNRH